MDGKHQVGGDRWPDGTVTKSCVCRLCFHFFHPSVFSFWQIYVLRLHRQLTFKGKEKKKFLSCHSFSLRHKGFQSECGTRMSWLFMTCICFPCDDLPNLLQRFAQEPAVCATTPCQNSASRGAEIFPTRRQEPCASCPLIKIKHT